MSEKVIEIEKINWPLWILVIIIVNVLANLAQGILGAQGQFFGCIYSVGTISIPFTIYPLALILPLGLLPLKIARKSELHTSVLVYLYTIGFASSMAIGLFWYYIFWPVGTAISVWMTAEPAVRDAMSKLWWVPPESHIRVVIGPGGPVDWVAWFPAASFTFLLYFIMFILGLSQMSLLRRRWIEVERVPYPVAIAMWEGIRNAYGFNEVRRRRPFLIGLAVGLIITLQIMFTALFPWWPDILGWRANGVSPIGCVRTNVGDPSWTIASQLVAFMRWNMQPINYAIAYLVPLDVLFTAWFLWIIFMIAAQVAYYMGYYTGALNYSGCCRVLGWGGIKISPNWGPPIYWSWMCLTGGMVALAVMMLWYSRDYLREVVRAALGRPSPYIKETEIREPLSYRVAFTLLVLGCILFIAFMVSLQMDLLMGSVLFIFGGFLYPIVDSYAQGLTGGGYAWGRVLWPSWPLHLVYSRHPGYTPGLCMGILIMEAEVDAPSGALVAWTTCTMSLFRVADTSGIHPRQIVKLLLMTVIIAYPITIAFRIWWAHYLGARFPHYTNAFANFGLMEGYYNLVPPAEELATPIVAGFIITVLLFILRARFAWWPLHPMGFLISGGQYQTWTGTWTNFLAAWVLKWLTLKIGGSKAYEEYGVPCVAGVIIGYVIVVIIGIFAGLIRWFIPF
jgi:hypothetical protein